MELAEKTGKGESAAEQFRESNILRIDNFYKAREVLQHAHNHPGSEGETQVLGGDFLQGADFIFNDRVWKMREVQPISIALTEPTKLVYEFYGRQKMQSKVCKNR